MAHIFEVFKTHKGSIVDLQDEDESVCKGEIRLYMNTKSAEPMRVEKYTNREEQDAAMAKALSGMANIYSFWK